MPLSKRKDDRKERELKKNLNLANRFLKPAKTNGVSVGPSKATTSHNFFMQYVLFIQMVDNIFSLW